MWRLGPVWLSSEDSSDWSSAAHSVQGVFVVASQTEWNVIEVSLDAMKDGHSVRVEDGD